MEKLEIKNLLDSKTTLEKRKKKIVITPINLMRLNEAAVSAILRFTMIKNKKRQAHNYPFATASHNNDTIH